MTDKKSKFGVVEGFLVYAKIAEPDFAYKSKDTEYTIGIIVDEDTADAFESQFKKQAPKKIKASEFEQKYKFPLPKKFEGEKNVYQITLRRADTKDGVKLNENMRPRVFLDTADGRVDITESRLIANSSYGKVSYYISENSFTKDGVVQHVTNARLQNILMNEDGFVEYERKGSGGVAGSEFGDEVVPVKVEPANEAVTKARANKAAESTKPVKVVKEPEPDFDDNDPPF